MEASSAECTVCAREDAAQSNAVRMCLDCMLQEQNLVSVSKKQVAVVRIAKVDVKFLL